MAIAETLKAAVEHRAKIFTDQTALVELADKEDRVFTGDEETAYQKLEEAFAEADAEVERFEAQRKRAVAIAERREKLAASGRELDDRGRPIDRDRHGRINVDFMETGEPNEEAREMALAAKFMRPAMRNDRHRRALDVCGLDPYDNEFEIRLPCYDAGEMPSLGELQQRKREIRRNRFERESRISLVGDDSTGGFWAPESFVVDLEIAMLAFGGMLQVSDVRRTATGERMTFPSSNDTANEGRLVGEGQASTTDVNIAAAAIVLGAFDYTSDAALVTTSLMRDVAINVVAEVGRMLGERLGRIQNRHATTGDGAAKAEGITVGAPTGVTAASATVLTDLELVDLKHSVDPAYRGMSPSFMFHDSTLQALKKLTDGTGRRLWQAGMSVGDPGTIDGDPYTINQHMASIAASAISVIYGVLRKYLIRQVQTVRIHRLVERFRIENDADAFVAFMSMDGKLRDAGTNPVKKLVQAA